MKIIELLKDAAQKSGNPIDDVAVKLLEQIITPELEQKMKDDFIAWVKSKVNDPSSKLDDFAVEALANLIGASIP